MTEYKGFACYERKLRKRITLYEHLSTSRSPDVTDDDDDVTMSWQLGCGTNFGPLSWIIVVAEQL